MNYREMAYIDTLKITVNMICILSLSYVVGSFPTSIIAGRVLKGIDIRKYGSGNAGGTNSFRVLGWKAGIVVASIDIFKGFSATFWISQLNIFNLQLEMSTFIPVLAGVSAVAGHCFTVFAGFSGGKGIATSAGMLIALSPIVFLICLGVFTAVLFYSGYVSLSSMAAAAALPIVLIILKSTSMNVIGIPFLIFGVFAAAFIFYTHRSNIKRLINGTENRFNSIRIFRKYV